MDSFEESFDKVKKGFVSSLNKVRGKEEPEPVPEDEQSFFSESVSGVSRQCSHTPAGDVSPRMILGQESSGSFVEATSNRVWYLCRDSSCRCRSGESKINT